MQMSSSGGQVPDPGLSFYNASKFGIEGFYESAAMELAPFGIEVTLVEPGGNRTNFNSAMVLSKPIPAYRKGIVGQVRSMLTDNPDAEFVRRAVIGDPPRSPRPSSTPWTSRPPPGGSRSAATPMRRSPPRGVTAWPHSKPSATSPTVRTPMTSSGPGPRHAAGCSSGPEGVLSCPC